MLLILQEILQSHPFLMSWSVKTQGCQWYRVEMATAQRTRPRAVVGTPRRAVWQPKSVLRHSVSVAPRTIIFIFFYNYCKWIILLCPTMVGHDATIIWIEDNNKIWNHVVTIHMFRVLKQSMVPSVEAIIAWCIFFENSEHPKIGYFGYNILVLIGWACFLTPRKRFWFW